MFLDKLHKLFILYLSILLHDLCLEVNLALHLSICSFIFVSVYWYIYTGEKAAVEMDFVVLSSVVLQKPKSTNMPYTNLVIYYVHVRRNDKDVKDKMRFNTIRR